MPDTPQRTAAQLRSHYEVERELADRLRYAPAESRPRLYAEVYDELFRRVPDHPQLSRVAEPDAQKRLVDHQWQLLGPWVDRIRGENAKLGCYLEIGAGDCALVSKVASESEHAVAVDVSQEILDRAKTPPNVTKALSVDGVQLPVARDSVDLAYSHQLMEHLHPEDAEAQLRELHRVLKPGGAYVCVTPSRLSGPHDISKFFDRRATGLHLVEYTGGTLARVFRDAGFVRLSLMVSVKGRCAQWPLGAFRAMEELARFTPARLRRGVGATALGLTMVGRKAA